MAQLCNFCVFGFYTLNLISGGSYNVDSGTYISGSAPYKAGSAAAYVSGNGASAGSATGYETPFDKHVDNYNELISNPFNSNVRYAVLFALHYNLNHNSETHALFSNMVHDQSQ